MYSCPIALVLIIFIVILSDHLIHENNVSKGLFSYKVLLNCFLAPFIVPAFNEIYIADYLTSLTKTISDSIYSACWLLSGAFLEQTAETSNYSEFGGDNFMCTGHKQTIVINMIVIIPLWIRTIQCLRMLYLNKGYWLYNLLNTFKYLSSIMVTFYGLFINQKDNMYLALVIFATLYKWLWDVIMDWGLFDQIISIMNPNVIKNDILLLFSTKSSSTITSHLNRLFLRKLRLYPHAYMYYSAILIDLILRFFWVLSLSSINFQKNMYASAYSFFLGCIEIGRRSMWGAFRIEYEHLKCVINGTPGFLEVNKSVQEIEDGLELKHFDVVKNPIVKICTNTGQVLNISK